VYGIFYAEPLGGKIKQSKTKTEFSKILKDLNTPEINLWYKD